MTELRQARPQEWASTVLTTVGQACGTTSREVLGKTIARVVERTEEGWSLPKIKAHLALVYLDFAKVQSLTLEGFMSSDEEATRQWWEDRVAREAAEKDARTGTYNPPPTAAGKEIYDQVYQQIRAQLNAPAPAITALGQNERIQAIPVNPTSPPVAISSEEGVHLPSCIVSFVITLGIAITVGLAVPFVIGILLTSMLGGPSVIVFVLTGVIYLGLFGLIWWAIYGVMKPKVATIPISSRLVGRWRIEAPYVEGISKNKQTTKIKVFLSDLEFFPDGTYVIRADEGIIRGKFSVENKNLKLEVIESSNPHVISGRSIDQQFDLLADKLSFALGVKGKDEIYYTATAVLHKVESTSVSHHPQL